MDKKVKEKKKFSFIFWPVFTLCVLLACGGILYGLDYLWDYLEDYEKTRPVYVIEEIVQKVNQGDYKMLVEASDMSDYEYADAESIADQLKSLVGDKKVEYVTAFSYDRVEAPTYDLVVDDLVIAKVILGLTEEKSEFGRQFYGLNKVEKLYCSDYRIIKVPSNYVVTVNGKPMNSEWLFETEVTDLEVKYMLCSEEEGALWAQMNTYVVEGFASASQIEVFMPGGEVKAETFLTESGILTVKETFEITLTAPFNTTVTVNGIEISARDKWVTGRSDPLEALERIEDKYFTQRPVYVSYKVTGLIEEPEVTMVNVCGDDKEVEYDEEQRHYQTDFSADTLLHQDMADMTLEYGIMYAKTTTADFPKDEFLTYLLYGGPMYKEIDESLIQYYYTDHERYWFEEEQVFALEIYSEDCFSCETSFVQWIAQIRTDPDFKESFHSHWRLYFIKVDGQWYLAEWELKG